MKIKLQEFQSLKVDLTKWFQLKKTNFNLLFKPIFKRSKAIWFLVFCLFMLKNSLAQNTIDEAIEKYNSNAVEYISAIQLTKLLQKKPNIKLFDTRAKSEFNVSHLKNSIFVGYDEFQLEKIQQEIHKNDTIVVYCSVGVRSEQIGEQLQKAGYTNVYNLYGGIFDWKNSNYPIYNLQNKATDSIHAYNKKWGEFIKKGIKIYE